MKRSVVRRVAVMFAACILALGIIFCYFAYTQQMRQVNDVYATMSKICADITADTLEGVDLPRFLSTGKTALYEELFKKLAYIKNSFGLEYLYVYIPDFDANELTMIYDIGSSEKENIETRDLGAVVPWQITETEANAWKGVEDQRAFLNENQFGYTMTCYAAVLDGDGSPQALVGADYLMDKVRQRIISDFTLAAVVVVASLVLLFVVMLNLFKRAFVKPVLLISERMDSFVEKSGAEFVPVEINTGDEIARMARSFNKMAGDIREYVGHIAQMTASEERIKTELNVAKRIQTGLLPGYKEFLGDGRFDICALMRAAREVGGDFYDIAMLDENRLLTVIGDVSGKGVSAALFMSMAKTMVKDYIDRAISLEDVLYSVNNRLCEGNPDGMFVTLFVGVLELQSGMYCYANAGHNPPYIIKNGVPERLLVPAGTALGALENQVYEGRKIKLDGGDGVFIYTDGVTEAESPEKKFYGEERLKGLLGGGDCAEIVNGVLCDLDRFAGGGAQADDITMLCFRWKGKE